MLALAQEVGDEIAPLLALAGPSSGTRAGGLDAARALVDGFVDLLGPAPRGVAHAQPRRAGRRPALPRGAATATLREFTSRLPAKIADARRRGRVADEMSPVAAGAALVALIERMAAFHRELEPIGIGASRSRRDDGADHPPDRGRTELDRQSARSRAGSPARRSTTASFASSASTLRGVRRSASPQSLVGRVRREHRERVDRFVERPVRAELTRRPRAPRRACAGSSGSIAVAGRFASRSSATSVRSSRIVSSCSAQCRHTAPSMSRSAASGSPSALVAVSSVTERAASTTQARRAPRASNGSARRPSRAATPASLASTSMLKPLGPRSCAQPGRGSEDARPGRSYQFASRRTHTSSPLRCPAPSRVARSDAADHVRAVDSTSCRFCCRSRDDRCASDVARSGVAGHDRELELRGRRPSRTGRGGGARPTAPARRRRARAAAARRGRPRRSTSTSSTTPRRPRSRPSATRSSAASLRTRSRSSVSSAAKRGSDGFGSPRRWWRTSVGEERDLVGCEPAQLRVLDEVRRVPVVALARDVLADVVQQRRELEHLAVVGAEPVQRLRLVEQAQREPRDVRGVLVVGVAPAREAGDRGAAQRARIVGPVVGIVRAAPRRARCLRAAPSR